MHMICKKKIKMLFTVYEAVEKSSIVACIDSNVMLNTNASEK